MSRPATARIARLAQIGYKPLSLPLELAAAFVGYGPDEFLRLVTAGKYPSALNDGANPAHWSVEALQAAHRTAAGIEIVSGPAKPDYQATIRKRLSANQD